MDEERHHAGERAEPDGDDEEHGEHQLVDGAEGVHQPPDRLVDPPRDHVVRAEDARRTEAITASVVPHTAICTVRITSSR